MALYAPRSGDFWNPVNISTIGHYSAGYTAVATGGGAIAAAAWPADNLVIYVPFWLAEPTTATKLWWVVGAAAGNVDVGIYDNSGNLLTSAGSTTVAGAGEVQSVDITDIVLNRGNYYFGMVASTITTLTLYRQSVSVGTLQSAGLLEQVSAAPPLATNASPATFAKFTRITNPVCGFLGNRTAL